MRRQGRGSCTTGAGLRSEATARQAGRQWNSKATGTSLIFENDLGVQCRSSSAPISINSTIEMYPSSGSWPFKDALLSATGIAQALQLGRRDELAQDVQRLR